jgi:twitching motility protein PilT
VIEMATQSSGLLILSGAVGSGKSTTLAALIQRIAKTRPMKIITIEDPVEYLHRHQSAAIIQREVGVDTLSPRMAMRSLFRQDPDVIMIGEMRDLETIHTALTLAQTGQLVLGTLHNTDAMQAINRIVDAFPPEQQDQIRLQLSLVLIGVVVQQLVPTVDEKKRILALEILQNNSAVRNLIRKNEIHQILSVMQTGGEEGMCTLEKSLRRLYEQGIITIGEYEKRSPERKERANRQTGMTLLEVIISSVLLAWLILGMFSVYSAVQKMMQRTNRIQYALFLTQERVEQLTGLGFAGYAGYPNSDGGFTFDPNFFYTPAAPFKITEQGANIAAAMGGDANDFIRRYLVRRETMIWNLDDWNPDGTVDYRKIEVKVVWSEQVGT